MKKQIRTWIIYSSRKGGHTYPSKALYDYLISKTQNLTHPQIINLLDISPSLSLLEKIGGKGDLKLRRFYRKCYRNLQEENPLLLGSYRLVEQMLFHTGKLHKKLLFRYGQPDIIVTIQPEVNAIADLLKDRFSVPIHTIIIDLAIHGLWLNRSIDHYYVANKQLKEELVRYRIEPDNISVTGIPLRQGFSHIIKYDINRIRKSLNISTNFPTILLMAGLLGTMVDFSSAIESVMRITTPFQLLAVFGKNDKHMAKAEILKRKSKWPMHFFGTVSNVDKMMWASDIIISKPGSVTISEALSLGKPMVVITPRAGSAQELRFAQFLKANQAGEWLKSTKNLGATIDDLLNSKDRYNRMRRCAWELGHLSLTATEAISNNIIRSMQ